MDAENKNLEMTDVMVRLKDGFEDKDAQRIRQEFTDDAMLNFDGRFSTVQELSERLAILFESIDQTYIDIARIETIDPDKERPFISYLADVAWVNKRDWNEQSYRVRIGLTLSRAKHPRAFVIGGISVNTLSKGDDRKDDDFDKQFPDDVGGAHQPQPTGFDLFSFWY